MNGSAADEDIWGGADNDTLYGGAGNDMLDGGMGSDTYHFGRGDGQDTVLVQGLGNTEKDRLQLGQGIQLSDLAFREESGALMLRLKGSSDSVRLEGYFGSQADIVLADGTTLNREAIERMLSGDVSNGTTAYDDLIEAIINGRDIDVMGLLGKLSIGGNSDSQTNAYIEQIKTGDGKTLLDTQVDALVSAMAGFAAPPASLNSLSTRDQTTLNAVIAANWK